MKYFTPELLARCRSRDDDVADAANEEWEQALADYEQRLASVANQLPAEVRELCATVSLHDGKMLGVAFGKRTRLFSMLVQLEGTAKQRGEVLQLHYDPVPGPDGGVAIREPAQGNRDEDVWVLYDEFDRDEEHDFFTHSLLLTDGREIEIRFRELTFRYLGDVVLPERLTPRTKNWPLVEAATEG